MTRRNGETTADALARYRAEGIALASAYAVMPEVLTVEEWQAEALNPPENMSLGG